MKDALKRGALLGVLLGAVALATVLGLTFLGTNEPDIGYGKLVLGLTVLCLGAGAPAGALVGGLQYHRAMMEPEAAPPIMDEDPYEYQIYEDDGWDADIEDAEGPDEPPQDPTLAEKIVECARLQAMWHYERGREPTRGAFKEAGVSQPIWNSARHLLKIMKLVGGSGRSVSWESAHASKVKKYLNRIAADGDKIWVPTFGNGHDYHQIGVSETLEKNRHTRYRPAYTAPLHSG